MCVDMFPTINHVLGRCGHIKSSTNNRRFQKIVNVTFSLIYGLSIHEHNTQGGWTLTFTGTKISKIHKVSKLQTRISGND